MKSIFYIFRLKSEVGKQVLVRNIRRFLDIRIMDIPMRQRTITFAHDGVSAFEKAERKLIRIGVPMQKSEHLTWIPSGSLQNSLKPKRRS